MASLWIRSGYDVKVEVSAQTYQVGAHINALIKAVLIASVKTLENFFFISRVADGQCARMLPPILLYRFMLPTECFGQSSA